MCVHAPICQGRRIESEGDRKPAVAFLLPLSSGFYEHAPFSHFGCQREGRKSRKKRGEEKPDTNHAAKKEEEEENICP